MKKAKRIILGAFLALMSHLPAFAVVSADSGAAGIAAFEKKDYRQSVILLDKTLSAHPDNARAWYYRALAYERSGCLAAAKLAFNDVITHCPKSHEAELATMGLSQFEEGSETASPPEPTITQTKVTSPSATNPEITQDNLPDSYAIPFEMINSRTILSAHILGATTPVEFDTGSDHVVLSKSLCEQYGVHLPALGNPTAIYKDGRKVWTIHGDVSVGDVKRTNYPIMVFCEGNWPSHILIGNDFFQGYLVEKDIKYNQLLLRKTATITPNTAQAKSAQANSNRNSQPHYSNQGCIEIPFTSPAKSQRILVNAKVNGVSVQLLFDSGATPGVSFSYQQLDASKITADISARTNYFAGGIAHKLAYFDVDFGIFQSYHNAGTVFDKSDATWGTAYPTLGPDIFEKQGYSWSIDRDSKVIRLRQMN
ncbi:MAG: aspartyl protease family protein [Candidatus Obscuribacterales bacterium]|nr:aspartyl protease family protein [Candidatus Obscuribacterales bacterium]